MPLECHTLTMNTIELQLSDTVAEISMLQCIAQFRILFIYSHFVADNASHALASSATVKPTFIVEEEVVVIRNGWTPKKEEVQLKPNGKTLEMGPSRPCHMICLLNDHVTDLIFLGVFIT